MCGIAGLIDVESGSDLLAERVRAMLDPIVHRGPDDRGEWTENGAPVALGLCRLAIVDLSPTGHQPMLSASGRWVIALNGEIYNFRRLRAELEDENEFRGSSDTEVALAAIERWGLRGALDRFVGMFAMALWDRQERRLHLVRDRLGVKPLYWGCAGSAIVFGSELKALAAHPEFERRVDQEALDRFLRFGYVPDPLSIWRDARKLPPGTVVTIAPGESALPDPESYWSPAEVAKAGLLDPLNVAEEDATTQVDELLRDSIAIRMIADVPLGVFLSGGIDSSTVAALMQAQSGRPIRTFSIGFEDRAFDESPWARDVSRRLGTDHTELHATAADALAAVPTLPEMFDEPFADSSQIPTWLVAKQARRHVTVALTGDGGDELFGGYVRHVFAAGRWTSLRRIPGILRRVASSAALAVPEPVWSWTVDRAARHAALLGEVARPSEKLRKAATAFAAADADDLWDRLVTLWRKPPLMAARPILHRDGNREWPGSDAERLMLLDLERYLTGDLLVKVDRASMAVSLEAREPLLDHRLVELAWRLPLSMRVRDGKGKWILRQILSSYLPPDLIDRPKMGFAVPLGEWLRGPLAEWAGDLLSESRLRNEGFLDPAPIREAWSEHCRGFRNHEHRIWSILMFEAWLDRWGGKS